MGVKNTRVSHQVPDGLWKRHGLSIVLLSLFLASLVGQVISGRTVLNEERQEEGRPTVSWIDYFTEGQFVSATFENWESEFLQMGVYVLLTVGLRQRGSAESRPFPPEPPERIEAGPTPPSATAGGVRGALYRNSLSLAFALLAVVSLALHALGSWRQEVDKDLAQGLAPQTLLEHLGGAQFWFESLQNWQSEFLAVFALVVLSIWLRQKDSPQSKPVDAPHAQTGT